MAGHQPIFVGVDGSPASVDAADVAGSEAVYRNADLVLLHVGPADDRIFERSMARLRLRHPTVSVSARHVPAVAGVADVLASHAATGGMLFVGHRPMHTRRNGPPSVAQRLVDIGTVPTIVYRPLDLALAVPEPRRVLAGVAPQGSAEAVLEFATVEAARRRASLDVVCVVRDGVAGPDESQIESVHRWLDKYPEISGQLHLRQGIDPAIALMVESHTAQLVVVGATVTRQGASVAHALVHRAACPVAIVPSSLL